MTVAEMKKPILLVALGGNALIKKGQQGTIDEQFFNLQVPARQIARLSSTHRIIITHGNGPQVGNLLLQQESCQHAPKLPLEILVAQTQGQIGYMVESTLDTALMAQGIVAKPLVSLISYVVVDPKDPAFKTPSKPIGPVYTKNQAARLSFPTVPTAKGYRRVVASPEPVTIVEREEIRQLVALDFIVICCGGGGIPVVRRGRAFSGVDAVIDKDLASACLAKEVGVDIFLMATDVSRLCLNFGHPDQKEVKALSCADAVSLLAKDHFEAGSMAPKVEAAVRFIQSGGKRAVITSLDKIEKAVMGSAGTQIGCEKTLF